jgi:catechol 2,3-dioxygenase-like lactoylglutathione lyase family enzyme
MGKQTMSVIKAVDVAYVHFAVPDIAKQRAFLADFGMTEVGEVDGTLYLRGAGEAPFCYALSQGEPAFLGLGVWAKDRTDLDAIAAHDGVAVEALTSPGGGFRARLTDPDGLCIDVISGQIMNTPAAAAPHPWNEGNNRLSRLSTFRRTPAGPSTVQRLGHVVLAVSDFRTSETWYKARFGLLTSDEVQPAPGIAIGAFMRADRGDEPTDHHMIVCFQSGAPAGHMHSAFEVAGADDLMVGHDHLAAKGYTPQWGVGRHILGSQIFDYWLDPFGNEIEHWTDGDQLCANDGGGVAGMDVVLGVQWGMQMPSPPEIAV